MGRGVRERVIDVKRGDGDVDMHVVALIATMIAAGAAVSAYVAQRGESALIPIRIKPRLD